MKKSCLNLIDQCDGNMYTPNNVNSPITTNIIPKISSIGPAILPALVDTSYMMTLRPLNPWNNPAANKINSIMLYPIFE